MKKQPEQTAQTRRSMMDAFWMLAKARGLHGVTISEIAKVAGYNRGTFYVYFRDLDDLLQQAEDEILCVFREQMQAALANGITTDLPNASAKVIEMLCHYDDKLFLLLGKNGDANFLSKFRAEAAQLFQLAIHTPQPHPYQEYIVAYVTAAFTGLLTYWYDTGKKISMEELSMISRSLATKGLVGLAEGEGVFRFR